MAYTNERKVTWKQDYFYQHERKKGDTDQKVVVTDVQAQNWVDKGIATVDGFKAGNEPAESARAADEKEAKASSTKK